MAKLPPPVPADAIAPKQRKVSSGLPKLHEPTQSTLKSSPIIDASQLQTQLNTDMNKNINNNNINNDNNNSVNGANGADLPQDKESIRKRKRQRQIKEIIETENVYVTYMTALRDLYLYPLQTNGLIKPKHLKIIFCDLETIINLNSKLLHC